MTKRAHTLVRIRVGDYLLLSNDGRTLWRLSTYEEDGSAVRGDGSEVVGKFWGLWRYRRDVSRGMTVSADWSDFEMWDSLLRRRKDAVQAALAHG